MSQTRWRIWAHNSPCRMVGRELLARLDGLPSATRFSSRLPSRAGAMLGMLRLNQRLWGTFGLHHLPLRSRCWRYAWEMTGRLQRWCQCSRVEPPTFCSDWRSLDGIDWCREMASATSVLTGGCKRGNYLQTRWSVFPDWTSSSTPCASALACHATILIHEHIFLLESSRVIAR